MWELLVRQDGAKVAQFVLILAPIYFCPISNLTYFLLLTTLISLIKVIKVKGDFAAAINCF